MAIKSWKEYEETKSKASVLRQLHDLKYELTQRTFYRHCKNGQCRVNDEGVYSRRMLKLYIEAEGIKQTGNTVEDENGPSTVLSVEKQQLENQKLRIQNRTSELNLKKKEGKLIERERFDTEMSTRAVALSNGFHQMIEMEAPALITAVGGDVSRLVEFVDLISQVWDELLNNYSRNDEFEVLFEEENK